MTAHQQPAARVPIRFSPVSCAATALRDARAGGGVGHENHCGASAGPAGSVLFLDISASTASASAASGPGTQVTLTEADRAQGADRRSGRSLPAGRRTFRTIIGQRDASGVVTVCGFFNGGSGDTPFVGTLGGGGVYAHRLFGGPTERSIAVRRPAAAGAYTSDGRSGAAARPVHIYTIYLTNSH